MKNALIYLFTFILGAVSCFLVLRFTSLIEITPKVKTVVREKIRTKTVRDTVVLTKPSTKKYNPSDTLTFEDSLLIAQSLDTLFDPPADEIIVDEDIITERMVSKRNITVIKEVPDSLDATELLNINANSFSNSITVEFWESPLELTGYELTRNKLKLFGFNPNESITLRLAEDKDYLILKTETLNLILTKSKKFKSLNL
ncbi:MAG: hypothetical protein R3277_12085 [Brumimicrobium sp.]|nr:hypothetical protein [Brumimicrobium sp.]